MIAAGGSNKIPVPDVSPAAQAAHVHNVRHDEIEFRHAEIGLRHVEIGLRHVEIEFHHAKMNRVMPKMDFIMSEMDFEMTKSRFIMTAIGFRHARIDFRYVEFNFAMPKSNRAMAKNEGPPLGVGAKLDLLQTAEDFLGVGMADGEGRHSRRVRTADQFKSGPRCGPYRAFVRQRTCPRKRGTIAPELIRLSRRRKFAFA